MYSYNKNIFINVVILLLFLFILTSNSVASQKHVALVITNSNNKQALHAPFTRSIQSNSKRLTKMHASNESVTLYATLSVDVEANDNVINNYNFSMGKL